MSERRANNGQCVACGPERVKIWRTANPDKVARRINRWKAANPDKIAAIRRRWRQSHPDACRLHFRAYRAKKRAAKGSHTIDDIKMLFRKQKGRCLCRVKLVKGYHVDHKTPLIRGGSNWLRNLQLLCASCNSKKGAKTMKEWKRYV